jgi:hypothetical protein
MTAHTARSPVVIAWDWMWHYLGYVAGGGAALLIFLAGVGCIVGFLYWMATLGDGPEVRGD